MEDIGLIPAQQVEFRAVGQEAKARGGDIAAPFAREHGVEPVAQSMQVGDVGGGISKLLFVQFGGAPVRRLLLLRYVDAEEFPAQVFQAVAVGVGADQLGSDLGTIDGRADDAEVVPQSGSYLTLMEIVLLICSTMQLCKENLRDFS